MPYPHSDALIKRLINTGSIDLSKENKVLYPVPTPLKQYGECCKLYSTVMAMLWLHETDSALPQPPPTRKRDASSAYAEKNSLRYQAKHPASEVGYQSQVGEIYDVNALSQLAIDNGFDKSRVTHSDSKAEYIQALIDFIDKGYAPVVFFDVGFETKGPESLAGKHEHAAVIAGYCYALDGRRLFLASCWGAYYLYSADDLYNSTSQLMLKREPERFFKDKDASHQWASVGGRYPQTPDHEMLWRSGVAPTSEDATFRGKILCIDATAAEAVDRSQFVKPLSEISIASEVKDDFTLPSVLMVPDIVAPENQIAAGNFAEGFLALSFVVNLFSKNSLLNDASRLSVEAIKAFVSDSQLNLTILQFCETYAVIADGSIEGDIFHQTTSAARSIIADITNALDAKPEAIRCDITDGSYKIEEKNGPGMTAEEIAQYYLVPRASTKSLETPNLNGRFGIGSFVKLMHLRQADAHIVIHTTTQAEGTYKIVFKLINQVICVSMTHDKLSKMACGTTVEVFSSEIKEAHYRNLVSQFICDPSIPVFINDDKFSSVPIEKGMIVSIENNVVIRQVTLPDSNTTSVHWRLPRTTGLLENYADIIVDQEDSVYLLKEEINKIYGLPGFEWVAYINTVLPVIQMLQAANGLPLARHNLLDYLFFVFEEKVLGIPPDKLKLIPDLAIYKKLQIPSRQAIHPYFLSEDWIQNIADLSDDFVNDATHTHVYISDLFIEAEDPNYFFYDEEKNHLWIDRNYYAAAKQNNFIDCFDAFFKDKMKKVNIKRKNRPVKDEAMAGCTTDSAEAQSSGNQLEDVYSKHGILSQYGNEFFQELLKKSSGLIELLAQTPTLNAHYPIREDADFYSYFLLTVCYNDAVFYYVPSAIEPIFFDEDFQRIYDISRFFRLAASLKKFFLGLDKEQLLAFSSKILDVDAKGAIRIDSAGVEESRKFKPPVNKMKSKGSEISDALSQRMVPQDRKIFIVKKNQGQDRKFEVEYSAFARYRLIFNNPCLLTANYKKIYHVEKETELKTQYDNNIASNEHILSYSIEKNDVFIYDQDGNCLLHTDKIKIPENIFTFCFKYQDEHNYAISMINHDFKLFFCQSIDGKWHGYANEQNKIRFQFVGFPVVAVVDTVEKHINTTLHAEKITTMILGECHFVDFQYDKNSLPAKTPHTILEIRQSLFSILENQYVYHVHFYFNFEGKLAWLDKNGGLLKTEQCWREDSYQQAIKEVKNKAGALEAYGISEKRPRDKLLGIELRLPLSDYGFCSAAKNDQEIRFSSGQLFHRLDNGALLSDVLNQRTLRCSGQSGKYLVAPISKKRLLASSAFENLEYLNNIYTNPEHRFSIDLYASCLRFIDWPSDCFQVMVPHVAHLIFTAKAQFAQYYSNFFQRMENYCYSDKQKISLIRLFDLLYDILHESDPRAVGSKLFVLLDYFEFISIDVLYFELKKQQLDLKRKLVNCKDVIFKLFDHCSAEIAAMVYYLLTSEDGSQLEMQVCSDLAGLEYKHCFYLTDLMMIYQLSHDEIKNLVNAEQDYVQERVNAVKEKCSGSLLMANMWHAIYHISNYNRHLYVRELLQNAIDASFNDRCLIGVNLFFENGCYVLRVDDQGIGMTLEEILCFFCQPYQSSKRKSHLQQNIGRYGVGAFSIYANAELIRMRSVKNGVITYVQFQPVFDIKTQRINDIEISWQQEGNASALPSGTVIERVIRVEIATLVYPAILMSVISRYAAGLDLGAVEISFNNQSINSHRECIATVKTSAVGSLTILSPGNNYITSNGLAVRPIGDLDGEFSSVLRNAVCQYGGVIVDVPPLYPINRNRNDFENKNIAEEALKPYVFTAYILVYVKRLMQDKATLDALPYDFFESFCRASISHRVTSLKLSDDVARVRACLPLMSYKQYSDPLNLALLIAHLNIFSLDEQKIKSSSAIIFSKTYSLMNLIVFYQEYSALPPLLSRPCFLEKMLNNFEGSREAVKQYYLASRRLPEKRVEFNCILNIDNRLHDAWWVLIKTTKNIIASFGYPDVAVGLSNMKHGGIAHVFCDIPGAMYWNIYGILSTSNHSFSRGIGEKVVDHYNCSAKLSLEVLLSLLNTISHELVHAMLEDQETVTHNQTFYLKQLKLLMSLPVKSSLDELMRAVPQREDNDQKPLTFNLPALLNEISSPDETVEVRHSL